MEDVPFVWAHPLFFALRAQMMSKLFRFSLNKCENYPYVEECPFVGEFICLYKEKILTFALLETINFNEKG